MPSVLLSTTLALSAILAVVSCNVGTDEPYLAGAPLVPLQPVSTSPLHDATDVPVNAEPWVRWNDRVHPSALAEGAVTLHAEGVLENGHAKVDLIDCTLAWRPQGWLAPNTSHVLTFEGLRGFGTSRQRGAVALSFTTGSVPAAEPPRPNPFFEEVYALTIGPRCASCHGSFRPPRGLDLSGPQSAEAALLGGHTAGIPEVPYVVPGDHAASYLFWKLLDLPGISGEAMPPAGSFPMDRACRTPDPELRRLADWVDGIGTR